jgi:hypothetical protein
LMTLDRLNHHDSKISRMYSLVAMPELPADERISPSTAPHSFIDDAVVHALLHQHHDAWQEQRYLGEDFAGRDDCTLLGSEARIVPQRQAIGPFFANAAELHRTQPVAAPQTPITAETPQAHSHRSWTWLSAAALILTAGICAVSAMPRSGSLRISPHSRASAPALLHSSDHALIVIDKSR